MKIIDATIKGVLVGMTESGHKVAQNCDIIETGKVDDGEFFSETLNRKCDERNRVMNALQR